MSIYRRGLAEIGVNHTPLPSRTKENALKSTNVQQKLDSKITCDFTNNPSTPSVGIKGEMRLKQSVGPKNLLNFHRDELRPSKLADDEIESVSRVDKSAMWILHSPTKEDFITLEDPQAQTLSKNEDQEPIEHFGEVDDDGRFEFFSRPDPVSDFTILEESDYRKFAVRKNFDRSFGDLSQSEIDHLDDILESMGYNDENLLIC